MEKDCEFCNNKFEDTAIKDYDNWQVQLFTNQYYLGRSLIKLKRHAVDITEMKSEERKELFEKIIPELKNTLDQLYEPDLYNYSSLGNDCRHLHFHIIPRYKKERIVNSEKFKDENWNSHYKGYPKNPEIKQETFKNIKKTIKEKI